MFDDRTNLSQQVTAELKKFFGEKVFATTIPRNVRLAEAPSHGKPVLLYDPKSRGAESYVQLAKEVIAKHMPGFVAFPELEKEDVAAEQVAAGGEKQAGNGPRWGGRRERGQVMTLELE